MDYVGFCDSNPYSAAGVDWYQWDLNSRAGTVVMPPESTVSRGRHADSPGLAEPGNTIIGIGKFDLVRSLADRHPRRDALRRIALYEAASSHPGHPAHLRRHPSVPSYGGGALFEPFESTLLPIINSDVASRTGLGTWRHDPRFEPGSQRRVAGGDASPAHGGHAGGITLGALGSQEFRPAAAWPRGWP